MGERFVLDILVNGERHVYGNDPAKKEPPALQPIVMTFYAYVLRCSDGTLYCGSTPDLEKRLHEHNHLKTGAKYTR